jgi:hypothetical protein
LEIALPRNRYSFIHAVHVTKHNRWILLIASGSWFNTQEIDGTIQHIYIIIYYTQR